MTDFNTSSHSERQLMKAVHINDTDSNQMPSPNGLSKTPPPVYNGAIVVVKDLPVVEMTPLTPL